MIDSSVIRQTAADAVAQLLGRPLKPGETLVSSGLIDSLSVLRLIGQLEKRLSIAIPTASLQPDDFDGLDLIVETIQRVTRRN